MMTMIISITCARLAGECGILLGVRMSAVGEMMSP